MRSHGKVPRAGAGEPKPEPGDPSLSGLTDPKAAGVLGTDCANGVRARRDDLNHQDHGGAERLRHPW